LEDSKENVDMLPGVNEHHDQVPPQGNSEAPPTYPLQQMNDYSFLNSLEPKDQTVIVIDENFNILNAHDFSIDQVNIKKPEHQVVMMNI